MCTFCVLYSFSSHKSVQCTTYNGCIWAYFHFSVNNFWIHGHFNFLCGRTLRRKWENEKYNNMWMTKIFWILNANGYLHVSQTIEVHYRHATTNVCVLCISCHYTDTYIDAIWQWVMGEWQMHMCAQWSHITTVEQIFAYILQKKSKLTCKVIR